MPFKITITETRTRKKTVQPDYQKIGEREIIRDPEFLINRHDEPKTRIDSVYGYPPATEKEVEESVVRLEQTVDHLNLERVICAVNAIAPTK